MNFNIIDYATKKVIFEVGRDIPPPADMTVDFSALREDMYRKIKYSFSEDVLKLPAIQTSLVFSVGNKEVKSFRMIERHYFRDRLVKSFDFPFGFCIPSSTNSWDAMYNLPPMTDELINDMIENPYETKSDSFYFVDNKLIMHNKASYKYTREDAAQSKKSYEDKYGSKLSGSKTSKEVKAADAKVATAGAVDKAGVSMVADAKQSSSGTNSPTRSRVDSKGVKQEWSKEDDYN